MMQALFNYSPPIEEIYSQSLCSRRISRTQLHQLQSISGASLVTPQQDRLIKRLRHALRRGWISLVD